MPPSGFSSPVVAGALQFVGGCYQDLLREVREGKYVSYEEAIAAELKKIELALATLHIEPSGAIVEKKPFFYDQERWVERRPNISRSAIYEIMSRREKWTLCGIYIGFFAILAYYLATH